MKKTFSMLLIAATTLVACTPEDGDTGPAGPIGPEGQIGPAGNDGLDGLDGVDGNDGLDGLDGLDGVANISVRDYVVIDTDWSLGRAYKQNLDITQDVVAQGVVQAYRMTTSVNFTDTIWTALPAEPFGHAFKKDSVVFLTPGFSGASFTSEFRVIVIPPAVKVAGVDHSDYEAVEMVYGLEK